MTASEIILAELKTGGGELLSVLTVLPKQFKTGSRGYYANQKLEIDGKRYQLQIQLVEIGSKNSSDTPVKSGPAIDSSNQGQDAA